MDLIDRLATAQRSLHLKQALKRVCFGYLNSFQAVKRSTPLPQLLCRAGLSRLGLILLPWVFSVTFLTAGCLPKTDLSLPQKANPSSVEEQLSAPVGTSATALLDGKRFDELEIEIQPLGEAQLSQEAVNHIRSFVTQHLGMDSSKIDITLNPAVRNSLGSETRSRIDLLEVRALERRYRRTRPLLNRGSVFILVADAPFVDDTARRKTYALAHQNTSIVLYHPSLMNSLGATDSPERWQLEAAVVEHELGHLLGLVNLHRGSTDSHHESNHSPSHCSQPGCLMSENTYHATLIAGRTSADGIPQLCEKCADQLERLRAGHSP